MAFVTFQPACHSEILLRLARSPFSVKPSSLTPMKSLESLAQAQSGSPSQVFSPSATVPLLEVACILYISVVSQHGSFSKRTKLMLSSLVARAKKERMEWAAPPSTLDIVLAAVLQVAGKLYPTSATDSLLYSSYLPSPPTLT